MGLADVFAEIREERGQSMGERLFEWIGSREPRQKQPLQPGDLIRISSLGKLCPREEVLASKHDIIRIDKPDPSLAITFDIGDMFHDLYRGLYYGPMGEWRGAWECKRCGWDTDKAGLSHPPEKGQYKVKPPKLAAMPSKCPACGARSPRRCPRCGEWFATTCLGCGYAESALEAEYDYRLIGFKEWHVEDPEVGIKGHPDGWGVRGGTKTRLVDIKSISPNGFKRMSRTPLEGHAEQVWGYQHCCGHTDLCGTVLYANKSPWGDHTEFVREIKVKSFDKKTFDQVVRRPVEEVRNGLSGGPLPERFCVSQDCARANECQIADVCFGS